MTSFSSSYNDDGTVSGGITSHKALTDEPVVIYSRYDLVSWLLTYRRAAIRGGHGPLAHEPPWLTEMSRLNGDDE